MDDNKAFLHAASEFLQRHDELIVVGAIYGGEEVLAQAQELRAQVIRVDLDEPGLVGLEIVSRPRAAGSNDLVRQAELVTSLLPAIQWVTQTNRSR